MAASTDALVHGHSLAHRVRRHLILVREVFGLIWIQATPFVRVRLVVTLLLLVAMSLLTALGPLALQKVVDALAVAGRPTSLSLPVLLLMIAFAGSQGLSRGIGEIRGLIYARAERRMFRTLTERLLDHVMRLGLTFHQSRQTGALNQTIQNGLEGYQMIVHHLVFTLLPLAVELGTTSVVLLGLHQPMYFVLFAAALVCYCIAFVIAAVRVAAAASSASAAHISATATLTDAVMNYDTVKIFTAEELVLARASEALGRTEQEWVSFYRKYAVNGLLIAAIFGGFLLATVIYAGSQVSTRALTLGGFVLVVTYMLQLVKPVEMLGYAMQAFSQGTAMLENMLELFHQTPEPRGDEAIELPIGDGELRVENVNASYGNGRTILKELSFTVPAGRTLGIVGASGGGKSTIVRLLTRMLECESGQILLDGAAISALSVRRLRQAIAVVPQDTALFDDTIAYNIGFGRSGASRSEIEQAAKTAHLHEFICRLPQGYETRVGERGVKLSGGERQRIAIARAALKRPRIYIYDEATSSLDSRTEQEILTNIREISRTATTLIIAHRLSTVVHADEIIVLDAGSIVERGTHAALLDKSGRYAELWRTQQEGLSRRTA